MLPGRLFEKQLNHNLQATMMDTARGRLLVGLPVRSPAEVHEKYVYKHRLDVYLRELPCNPPMGALAHLPQCAAGWPKRTADGGAHSLRALGPGSTSPTPIQRTSPTPGQLCAVCCAVAALRQTPGRAKFKGTTCRHDGRMFPT